VWYRYCRLIIAGKEHIIKNVIDYFREQGESEVNLNEISQKLNVLDKSQKLPIIERRKKSIFFNNQEFTKFLDFSEKVDRLFSEHLRNEKTKEQKKIQKEEKKVFFLIIKNSLNFLTFQKKWIVYFLNIYEMKEQKSKKKYKKKKKQNLFQAKLLFIHAKM